MRQSIKPFVIQRKKKWQPKREPRPLFTRDELLHAEAQEAPPDVPALIRELPVAAVREPTPPPRRILLDLTVTSQPEPGNIRDGWKVPKDTVADEPPPLEAESDSRASQHASVEMRPDGPPHGEQRLVGAASDNEGRTNSRSKAKKVTSTPRWNSFSKMSIDQLVELRNEVERTLGEKIGQEQAQLQMRLDALGG